MRHPILKRLVRSISRRIRRPLMRIGVLSPAETCVGTIFRDRFDSMEFFVNYYANYWGIKKFVFAVGYTDKECLQDIESRVRALCTEGHESEVSFPEEPQAQMADIRYRAHHRSYGELSHGISIDLLIYRHRRRAVPEYFHKVTRPVLKRLVLDNLSFRYGNIFQMDCDEYYYSPEPQKVLAQSKATFHFVDFVPQKAFDPESDWKWSLQGWYYSQHVRERVTKNQITCHYCKEVYLEREGSYGKHLSEKNGASCKTIRETPVRQLDLLKHNICFHFAVRDKNRLLSQ